MAADILIIDDEIDIRDLIAGILSDEGYDTRVAYDYDSAMAAFQERVPQLVFLDIWLQGSRLDGLSLLDSLKMQYPNLPIVMISGHGSIETAVSAIKRGAYDFIEKPLKADRLVFVADRALETYKLKREVTELKKKVMDAPEILGTSPAITNLRRSILRIAPTNSRVLITGPSGSGKELAARTIHMSSPRANRSFVTVNAATITPDRMEIELFGTESGGGRRKVGALEEAHGGTLYIDEVADMPLETQNKIFRVLLNQTFERVGGTTPVKVDVRIISSTSRNIASMIADGSFREDLYHRLAVVPISIPALSERREDIPILIKYFLEQISNHYGIKMREIGDDAIALLQAHNWPGNVRQLRNNIERLLILTSTDDENDIITTDLLPPEVGDNLQNIPTDMSRHIMTLPLREAREIFEKEYLMAQVERFGGNISRTAEFVGMERSALHRKLRSLGV